MCTGPSHNLNWLYPIKGKTLARWTAITPRWSLFASHSWQFKVLEVFLPHTLYIYIYIYTHTQGLRWINRLHYAKMKINTVILLYKIYLQKLHENILKYYWLNLFIEITNGFNHGLQMTLEFLISLSDGLLIWIGKCCCHPWLQFIFGVAQIFVGLLFNCATHIIMKRIVIWGVR